MNKAVNRSSDPAEGYRYFKIGNETTDHAQRSSDDDARKLGLERLNPALGDPGYLIYRQRRKLVTEWFMSLPNTRLHVLDIGGRIQPYRPLIEDRLESYVAVDRILEGLVDVVSLGERLPFEAGHFDLVICTQVLSYVEEPSVLVSEIHRVLKPGGHALVSVPAFCPRFHDELWRFLPEGLKFLFTDFADVHIAPESGSVAGVLRTINELLFQCIEFPLLHRLVSRTLIPLFNCAGVVFDRLSGGNERLVANYSVWARRRA